MASQECVTEHRVFVYDRGGISRFHQLTEISEVQWERDRDGTSEATVKLTGLSCERQRSITASIASKRHELVIFRGNDRVWEGPIFRIGDQGSSITIVARDVTAYLFGTALSQVWDNTGANATEVTTRFGNIIEYELTHSRTVRKVGGGTIVRPGWEQLDPPANILPHLQIHHFPNEARTSAKTYPSQMTIGTHLAGAARSSGIDYTAVGRAIHLWDTSRNIGQIRTLTEADFNGNIIVTEYGADHTQGAYVSSGNEGVYGQAMNPDNLDFYGPWETVYTAYNEEGTGGPSQTELDSQASRNTSGRSPAPYEVRVPDNSTIRLGPTLSIMDLVPGVRVPLRATLNARPYEQDQKLDHLRVTETAEGEKVQVTLTPATRPDSDEEED